MPFIQNAPEQIVYILKFSKYIFLGRKLLGLGPPKWPKFILKFKAQLYYCDTVPCTFHPDQSIHLQSDWFLTCLITKILEMQIIQISKGGF